MSGKKPVHGLPCPDVTEREGMAQHSKSLKFRWLPVRFGCASPGPACRRSLALACLFQLRFGCPDCVRGRQLGGDRLRREMRSPDQAALGEAGDGGVCRFRLRFFGNSAGPVLRPAQSPGTGRRDGDGEDRLQALSPCRTGRMGVEPKRGATAGHDRGGAIRPSHARRFARCSGPPHNRPLHACRSSDGHRFGGGRLCW
jgi:hypothetical protein